MSYLFDLEFTRRSLDGWVAGVSRKFRHNLEIAQEEIRRDWQYELIRQSQTSGYGTWPSLNPKYEARKDKEHASGKFVYNSLLRRTGEMLDGYVDGIEFDLSRTTVFVTMYYPSNPKVEKYAMSHQGDIGQPVGVPERPFDLDRFEEIARDRIDDAMERATD